MCVTLYLIWLYKQGKISFVLCYIFSRLPVMHLIRDKAVLFFLKIFGYV